MQYCVSLQLGATEKNSTLPVQDFEDTVHNSVSYLN
jgi:hypothetical protein